MIILKIISDYNYQNIIKKQKFLMTYKSMKLVCLSMKIY